MCEHVDVQRAVHKIGSAFENEAKVPGALTTLSNLKDNHIFRGLRTLITPGAFAVLLCASTLGSAALLACWSAAVRTKACKDQPQVSTYFSSQVQAGLCVWKRPRM